MIKILFAIGILIVSYVSFGQDFPNLTGNNQVTSVAYWKKGDVRKFHVVKNESEFRNGKDKASNQSIVEYDLLIRVLGEQDSAYTLEMSYSNFKFPSNKKEDKITESFQRMSEGLKIRYCTDELGIYDSIINKEELTEKLNEQIDALKQHFEPILKKEMDLEKLDALFNHYKKVFSDPMNIDVLFAEDILRIHGYYGIEMIVAKPLDIEMYYPALNNFMLNGTGTITLNDINKSTKTFTFMANEEPNEEELKKYMGEIFEIFTMGMSKEKLDLSDFSFETSSKNRYTMELRTGWLVKSSHTITTAYRIEKRTVRSVTKTTYTAL